MICCDGNCFRCPYPDVPYECLSKPMTAKELKMEDWIEYQCVKHAILDPEKKESRMNDLLLRQQRGDYKPKRRENHYSPTMRRNQAAYGALHAFIREARENRGLTTRALADLAGVSPQAINMWENGYYKADWEKLCAILPELEVFADQAKVLYAKKKEPPQKKEIPWKASDITTERMRRNMTAGDVAAAIGVSRDTIRRWEKGRRRPNWSLLATVFPRFQQTGG